MGSVAIPSKEGSSSSLFTIVTYNTFLSTDNNQRSPYRNIKLGSLDKALDDLNSALYDLSEVLTEASQENLPTPSGIAIETAEFLIEQSYKIFPSRFEVYPDQDGAIAVDIYNGKGKSVLLLCDLTGEVLCLADVDGESSHKRYPQSETRELPDSFIRKALEEL